MTDTLAALRPDDADKLRTLATWFDHFDDWREATARIAPGIAEYREMQEDLRRIAAALAAEADRGTPRRTVIAHNHGPHDGPGLSCREYPVGECQRVLDLDSPEAEKAHREAMREVTRHLSIAGGDTGFERWLADTSAAILAALREQGR